VEGSELAREFHVAMHGIFEAAKERGYVATRFLQMLDKLGGVETAKQLLSGDAPQYGFVRLWEMGKPEASVEYLVTRPRFRTLFTPDEKKEARRRLSEIGFDPGPPIP
jgi:hypothetical protein